MTEVIQRVLWVDEGRAVPDTSLEVGSGSEGGCETRFGHGMWDPTII